MVESIHHIALIVSCEEAISFYEKLGFSKVKTVERKTDKIVMLSNGSINVEFFVDNTHTKNDTGTEFLGLRHIAFKVECVKNFLETYGFNNVEIKKDWNNENLAFVKDYDGNVLEIHE